MKLDNNVSSVKDTAQGVSVHLQGDEIELEKVNAMLEKCAEGTCSCCGPEFFEALDGVDVSGADGDIKMDINGSVDVQDISEKLATCDCYGTSK